MNTTHSKKYLLIQTAFIGDAVLASAQLESLILLDPLAEIHLLVRKGNETLFQQHPYLKKVWVWDKKENKYPNLWALLKAIRLEKFDFCITLQRFAATGFLTAFSSANVTIGFSKNPFSAFFTHKVTHQLDAGLHETERNAALLKPIFGDFTAQKPKLYPSKVDEAALRKLQDQPYVCMAPNSVWFTKQWPMHKWQELIALIPPSTAIYLLGAKGDSASCDALINQAQHPNIQSLAGTFSFLQSAALMQGAQMNYVNDSAPMHLASAVNAPLTVIFCSTVPAFGFGPLSSISRVIETSEALACRPCGLHGWKACPQKHFNCAEQIQAKTVFGTLN